MEKKAKSVNIGRVQGYCHTGRKIAKCAAEDWRRGTGDVRLGTRNKRN